MTTQPQTDDDIRLETIAKEIERLQGTAILRVADQLAKAHEIFCYRHDEGGFQGWVERRLTFSRRTAYNLLEVHKQFGGKECVQNLHTLPRSVLYMLAAPGTPDEARTEMIERAETGEKVSVADVKRSIDTAKGREQPAREAATKDPGTKGPIENGWISTAVWEIELAIVKLGAPAEAAANFPACHRNTITVQKLTDMVGWLSAFAEAWENTGGAA